MSTSPVTATIAVSVSVPKVASAIENVSLEPISQGYSPRAVTPNPDGRLLADLVERWIVRHTGEQRVLAALADQHVRPERFRVLGEDVVSRRRLDDPVVPLELVVQLARPPSGVAREHPQP